MKSYAPDNDAVAIHVHEGEITCTGGVEALTGIEKRITEMNEDPCLKNRRGLAKMPYMLLYPNTSDASGKSTGPVGMGIPNSVSI